MAQSSSPPLHYAIALFPGFQLLDLAGPLDVLNLLPSSKVTPGKNITLSLLASTLDPVPTKLLPPKSKAWTFDSDTISSSGLNPEFNQCIVPSDTFESYLEQINSNDARGHKPKPQIDVLIIPGGIGTRVDRLIPSTSTATTEPKAISNTADLRSFITSIAPHVKHSILTVCTGSYVLAQTGLLNGRRATTNMSRWDSVTSKHPEVKWEKRTRWVKSGSGSDSSTSNPTKQNDGDGNGDTAVFNGSIYTSAGVSAGIDVMLAFVVENYGGVETAREVARRLEYDWKEIGEGEVDPLYDGWDI